MKLCLKPQSERELGIYLRVKTLGSVPSTEEKIRETEELRETHHLGAVRRERLSLSPRPWNSSTHPVDLANTETVYFPALLESLTMKPPSLP